MQKDNTFTRIREVLTRYIEQNNLRKTPERYTVLEAACGIGGQFSIEELSDYLDRKLSFRVSRATLYNTLRLFMQLGIVVRHNLVTGTKYEVCYNEGSKIKQICTVCGDTRDVRSKQVTKDIEAIQHKRFRREGYTVFIYGVCTKCQMRIKRQMAAESRQKTEKQKKKIQK